VKHNVVSEKRPCIFGFVEKLFGCGKWFQKKERAQVARVLQNIINRYGIITERKVLIGQMKSVYTTNFDQTNIGYGNNDRL
jgi:hypothetical protein